MLNKPINVMLRVEKYLLCDFRGEHSEFQINNFILPGNGGLWERYKQALRELSARHKKIKKDIEEIAQTKKNIKICEGKFFKRKKVEVLNCQLKTLIESYKKRAREYFYLYKIAMELKRKLGEITPQKRRELEAQMWKEKARRMAAIDLLSIGGLQRSTVEFIVSFPREMRREIISDLRPENRQKLLSIID